MRDNWRIHFCQYIADDPRIDPEICGDPVKEGSPYCDFHHGECYEMKEVGNGRESN